MLFTKGWCNYHFCLFFCHYLSFFFLLQVASYFQWRGSVISHISHQSPAHVIVLFGQFLPFDKNRGHFHCDDFVISSLLWWFSCSDLPNICPNIKVIYKLRKAQINLHCIIFYTEGLKNIFRPWATLSQLDLSFNFPFKYLQEEIRLNANIFDCKQAH